MKLPLLMGFWAQMLLCQQMSVAHILDKLGEAAISKGARVSPWISGDEDFRESNDLSSLRRRLLNEGDRLVDASFEIIPHRFSLNGGDLELLTGERHDESCWIYPMRCETSYECLLTMNDSYCWKIW